MLQAHVGIDDLLVYHSEAFILDEFRLEVKEATLGSKEVVGQIQIIHLPEEPGLVPHSIVSRGGVENLPRSFLFFAYWLDHVWFRAKRIGFNNCCNIRSHLSVSATTLKLFYRR